MKTQHVHDNVFRHHRIAARRLDLAERGFGKLGMPDKGLHPSRAAEHGFQVWEGRKGIEIGMHEGKVFDIRTVAGLGPDADFKIGELFAEHIAPCLGIADMFVEIDDEQRQDRLLDDRAVSVAETQPVARRCHGAPAVIESPRERMAHTTPNSEDPMPFYEKGDTRIHYEKARSGFPLLVIPGGGLSSTIAGLATHPFNLFDEFKNELRVISADLRNANCGKSSGPPEVDRP